VQNSDFTRVINALAIIFLFLSSGCFALELAPLTHKLSPIKLPVKAPHLRLQDMDEEIIDIKELRGKVVIVNFWATWCPPCRREMSSLERLYLQTKDKDIVVLAVNIGEDADTVFPFLGDIDPSPSFPIVFDPDANSMKSWKVRGLPTTYIINTNGYIVYKAVGGREFDHPDILQTVLSLSK